MRFITLVALFRLTRFWNLVIIAIAQYFAAAFLFKIKQGVIWDWRLFVFSLSTILIAAAGYIINDYYDIKIDLINKPDRVVIGKSITRRYAILFHTFISSLGIILGTLVSLKIGLVNIICFFLLWLYSNKLKRLPFIGNLLVAILTGLAIGLVNLLYEVNNTLVVIYALFALFVTLVREIVKDIEDMKGDNTFGCKTLPILWGIRKTKWLLYLIIATFALVAVFFNITYNLLPPYYFVVILFLPLGFMVFRLVRADTKKEFYQLSQFCKVIMLLGIFSMMLI